jgi:hypothetical protein
MSASQLNVQQAAGVEIVRAGDRKRGVESQLKPCGHFVVEHWRKGKRINEYHFPNGITNEGKNKLLNVMFHGATAIGTWWIGLIDNSGYTALAATDTYDDINQVANGWDEFTTYTDAGNGGSASTRPQWSEGAASGQSITNASPAVFDLTGAGTVKGVFVVGGDAGSQNKSDHTAGSTLWSTALFTSGDVVVANGDQLKVTYTVSA